MTSPPSQPKTVGGGIEDDQDCDGVASDADPGDGAAERGHELDSAGDAVRAYVPIGRVCTLWGQTGEERSAMSTITICCIVRPCAGTTLRAALAALRPIYPLPLHVAGGGEIRKDHRSINMEALVS